MKINFNMIKKGRRLKGEQGFDVSYISGYDPESEEYKSD
jgi:hypothetical protein